MRDHKEAHMRAGSREDVSSEQFRQAQEEMTLFMRENSKKISTLRKNLLRLSVTFPVRVVAYV